jgi:exosortase
LGFLIHFPPIHSLSRLLFSNETYSHIIFIPAVSLAFLLLKRKAVFSETHSSPGPGLAVIGAGLATYAAAMLFGGELGGPAFRQQEVPNDFLTLCVISGVAWVIGSFLLVYGTGAFKRAKFGLLFLVLAIPLPLFVLNPAIALLQHASAETADWIFRLTGALYHREGDIFEFSNVTIRVAEVCSGIRSTLSLFILSIITGRLFLKSNWNRLVLALSVLPVTILKNALRIVTITLLANHVDMEFLTGHWIHRSGGMLFIFVAILMLAPIVWGLRRSESARAMCAAVADSAPKEGLLQRPSMLPPHSQ